jgi:hypothetical protein
VKLSFFWRYVSFMKNSPLFCALLMTVYGALAQTSMGKGPLVPKNELEQRRSELRSTLKPQRDRAMKEVAGKKEDALAAKRLSPQERADLRFQLRQDRRDGVSTYP